jgi:hypothetical protein
MNLSIIQITREPVGKAPWNDVCPSSAVIGGRPWCDVAVQVLRYQVGTSACYFSTAAASRCDVMPMMVEIMWTWPFPLNTGLHGPPHLVKPCASHVMVYGG